MTQPHGPQRERHAPEVVLVTSPACHLCSDARADLRQRSADGLLVVREVPGDSQEGQGLLATHRAAMFPLVLLDGEFISAGRLSRRRLERALAAAGKVS